ncbi:phosphohistidine phosphatase SixA [bacterium]|nr:phosphohistidine phosphatase SixA [bacterium]
MLLVLMRHGIAEDGSPDEARRLTGDGREKTVRVAKGLERFGVRPDLVITSHRIRAQETAQIVIETLGLKTKWVRSDGVDFYVPWEQFASDVNRRIKSSGAETVLVAGHMPQVSMLASMCLTGQEDDFRFRKSAAMGIEFDRRIESGTGNLLFYLTHSVAKTLQ